jgi:hypothetical protein
MMFHCGGARRALHTLRSATHHFPKCPWNGPSITASGERLGLFPPELVMKTRDLFSLLTLRVFDAHGGVKDVLCVVPRHRKACAVREETKAPPEHAKATAAILLRSTRRRGINSRPGDAFAADGRHTLTTESTEVRACLKQLGDGDLSEVGVCGAYCLCWPWKNS